MESTTTPQRALLKLLAIIGFFVLIALLIWALIQGIRAFPSAFSSLASIAETINKYRPDAELTMNQDRTEMQSGETFTITWNDMGDGAYLFAYDCVEGISVRTQKDGEEAQSLLCTDDATLSSDTSKLHITMESTREGEIPVVFSLAYEPEEGDVHVKEGSITIKKTAPEVTVEPTPETPATEPEPAKETPEVTETPKPREPQTPVVVTPAPITYYPPSLPNGTVDLKVSFLGVGTIERGNFIPKASFDEDDRAAFKFEVMNVGTKTSDSWTYKLSLPGDVDYTSKTQTPLLPNERVIFTVGFDLIESRDRSVSIEAEIDARGDSNERNDSFDWSVKVSN